MYCECVLYYILYYLTLLVNAYNFIPYVHVYLDGLDQYIISYVLEKNETLLYVRTSYVYKREYVPWTCRVYVLLLLPAQLDTAQVYVPVSLNVAEKIV